MDSQSKKALEHEDGEADTTLSDSMRKWLERANDACRRMATDEDYRKEIAKRIS
jgi:hypothetical protein